MVCWEAHLAAWLGPVWRAGGHLFGRRMLLDLDFHEGRLFSRRVASWLHTEDAAWLQNLSLDRLTAREAGRLARHPALGHVSSLYLSDAEAGAALALAASPHAGGLRRLTLHECDVSRDGVAALAASELLGRLWHLGLSESGLGATDAAELARSPLLPWSMDLSGNRLGDAGAEALAYSPGAVRLCVIDLSESGVGEAGAAALAGSPYLGGLRELWLTRNDGVVGTEAEVALRARFGARLRLTEADCAAM
jgi:hypothetical protein